MDLFDIVISGKISKEGGGGDVEVDALNVTENGTYTAEEGHAYSPVTVNVPSVTPTGNINITSTAQTDVSAYATAQVVDADLVAGNIKKDVDILGVVGTYEGGGGSSYTLLHEEDIEVSTTSTSAVSITTINVPGAYTSDILMCVATDKAGPREGYLYRTISWAVNPYAANGQTYNWTNSGIANIKRQSSTTWFGASSKGVSMGEIMSNGNVIIKAAYNSSSTGTIDGTYHFAFYKLKMPDGGSPFPSV